MKLSILALAMMISGKTAMAADYSATCWLNYSVEREILSSIQNEVTTKATVTTYRVLKDIYAKSGIQLTPSELVYRGTSFTGEEFYFEITKGTTRNEFTAQVDAASTILDKRFETDNSIYDDLGNLLAPATEVTCHGVKTYSNQIVITNRNTRKLISGERLDSLQPNATAIDLYGTAKRNLRSGSL